MFAVSVSDQDQSLPSPALRAFAWGVLAYFIAVILWGALVRATGAGAGCGNHWPLCNGTVMQRDASLNTLIEFTHRITSGLSLLAVLALAAWSFAGTVRGHLARAAAVASVGFTLLEALLGALLVALGLTAQSHSPLRPAFLALHLTNTLLLLAALALTAHLLNRCTGFRRETIRITTPIRSVMGILAVMIVGVSGSLAALGDTLFPPSSLGVALAQDFSANSLWLVRWRWTHPLIALAVGIFLVLLLVRARREQKDRRLSVLALVLLGSVCAVGVLNVALLAPVWAQVLHLLCADLLWVALVVLTARLTIVPHEMRVRG
jgi:cytochrome c oxidase assembly protein subunit 15